MKKVLFISPVIPNENGSGREKRAYLWISSLSKDYEVETIIINLKSETEKIKDTNLPLIRLEYSKKEKLKYLCAYALSIFSSDLKGIPYFFWLPLSSNQKAFLYHQFNNKKVEKVLCFRLYLIEFGRYLQKVTKAEQLELDLDDIESSTWKSIGRLMLSRGRIKAGVRNLITARFFRRCERIASKQVSKIYVCSSNDKQLLIDRQLKSTIDIFPNKIKKSNALKNRSSNGKTLLFVGTLNYFPNEDSVEWFVNNVFVKLRKEDDEFRLIVAGFSPSDKIKKVLSSSKGVTLYENVPSINSVYAQSDIVISPLRAGGGTKLKILEAMQLGLPVIATDESVCGLMLEPYVHYLPAESGEEFVQQCKKLCIDKKLSLLISKNAQKHIEERYTY